MKKKAKLVLPKIAEFQKDDEDISKGEDDAKFPSYKRKFRREKKTLNWPRSDVLPPIRPSGKLNLTCHRVGDGKTSGNTNCKWESVRPSTTPTTPHIMGLYLRLRVKTESLPKSITIIGQKTHQHKVPKIQTSNTGTSPNTEWPALSWKFPRRKYNTKAGHGRDMGELTCLLLITKTKLRERLPRVPIQDWVPGSVGIPTFHCRQCLQHWKMHGDLPEGCDQPEQIILGPAIFLTHSTPQKEKIPIKNAYTESGTQLHVSVSGKEGEKGNDDDPLVSPKNSQESLKNLLWKGESIEEDSSSETLDSEESMCLHPTGLSSNRDSLRQEQSGSSVNSEEPINNSNHSVTLPRINTSIAHQREDDGAKTVNLVSGIRNTSGSKDRADKLSANQGVQDKRTLQSSPVASGLQYGSGTRKFVHGAKQSTHSLTGHDHSDWQSPVSLDDKYKMHKHLQDDDKDSQDKTKTKFTNDVQLNTAEMPSNVTLSGFSDPQADSSHLSIKSKLKDHTGKQERITNTTSSQKPSNQSVELLEHNTNTLSRNPDNPKNGTSTSSVERDSESKGNRSQSNEEAVQFAKTSHPTHGLHDGPDGDTNTVKSDKIVSAGTDEKPKVGHAQKNKAAKKSEMKTLHQAILKENVELPRKNMERKKKRERKPGKKPNDSLNDHPRVVHSSKSRRGSFHIDPTASEETDGNHFNFSPSTALSNGSNVQSSALPSKTVRNMTLTHDVSVPSRHNSKDLKEGIVKPSDAYNDRRQSVYSSTHRPQSQLIRNNRNVSAQSNVSKDTSNSRNRNDPTTSTSYPKTKDGSLASTTTGSDKPNSQSVATRAPAIHYQKNSSSHLPYTHTGAEVTSSRYSAGVKQSEEHRQTVTDVDSSGQNILPKTKEPDPKMSKNEPITATDQNQSYNYETRQAGTDVTGSKGSIDSCNQDDSTKDREEAAIMEEYYATVKPAHFGLNSVSNFTPSFTYSMFPMSKQHRDRYDSIRLKVHTLRHKPQNKQTIVRS